MIKFLFRKKPHHLKKYLILTLAPIFILAIILFASYHAKKNPRSLSTPGSGFTYTVQLTQDGFNPKEIKINTGDTVKFVNTQKDPFWPASDPHPTHTNYPGFDPQKPIESGDSWSFKFDKPGLWRYHDHLNPSIIGTIEVGTTTTQVNKNCDSLPATQKDQCWFEYIQYTVQTKGIDAAFAQFADIFSKDQSLGCHWTAHLIGREAYKQYVAGKKFTISKSTSYCGYGFYHGFMELLLRNNPDKTLAVNFCQQVAAQLGSEGRDNCFHGIGHGFTEDPPNKFTWGHPDLMIKPSLKVCDDLLGAGSEQAQICYTGIFDVIKGFFRDSKYGLKLDHNDPFSFCRQPSEYQTACFGEFATIIDKQLNWEPAKLAKYMDGVADQPREAAIRLGVMAMMQRDIQDPNQDKYVLACRTYSEKDWLPCFRGIIFGFLNHGIPEQEYIKLLGFCSSGLLNDKERNYCYDLSFTRLKMRYSAEKIQSICSDVESKYKRYCSSNS